MIISHKYKYIFIELPRTGSTAIAKELIENYGGQNIYQKHTPYKYFYDNATENEKLYYSFSGVRNPMDRTVSLFFHLDKTMESLRIRMGRKQGVVMRMILLFSYHYFRRREKFVQENDPSFSEYFNTFYSMPYVDWSVLAHNRFNKVIRFENLNEDFQTVLSEIGIQSKGSLPLFNKTKGRSVDFMGYYDDSTKKRAFKVFGVYMYKLGYEFPKEWGDYYPGGIDKLLFLFKLGLMKLFWFLNYYKNKDY